jgi:hypothetical protein
VFIGQQRPNLKWKPTIPLIPPVQPTLMTRASAVSRGREPGERCEASGGIRMWEEVVQRPTNGGRRRERQRAAGSETTLETPEGA